MKRNRLAYLLAGGAVLAVLLLLTIFAAHVTPVSPDYRDATLSYLQKAPPYPPSARHILGTDQYGRDIWSRVVYGARWSLLFAALIMLARLAIALPAAYAAARRPRTVGWLVGRLYLLTGAIPPLVIYLLVLPNLGYRMLPLWPSFTVTTVLLALVEWPRLAVALQGRMETLLAEPFMEGAVAVGASAHQIYRQHLRPHLWPIVLQAAAQELGRALLVLGELGIFSIFAGGGVLTTDGTEFGLKVVSGVAEWGGMLADARAYMLTAPWAVFGPAVALFLAIAGANWLSQGLEGLVFPFTRWQQATTGRLSRRWHLLWAPVAAAVVLWYFQGVPWGREAEVQALVAGQRAALQAGDVAGYMQTVDPWDPDFRRDRQDWASQVTTVNWDATVGKFSGLYVRGRQAMASMQVPRQGVIPPGGSTTAYRTIQLARRWGRWYEVNEPLQAIRGYHTTLETPYSMNNPVATGVPERMLVITLSTEADQVYERVTALLPAAAAAPRPVLKLYRTGQAYQANVAPVDGTPLWYVPGKGILLDPDTLKTGDRTHLETLLAGEMLKALTPPEKALSPIALGLLVRQADGRSTYRADFRSMAGTKLAGLDQLFRITPETLTPQEQNSLAAQSALLIDFLGQWLDADRLEQLAKSGAGLTEVEAAAGVPLQEQYAGWLYAKVADESIMTVPIGQQRVPQALQAEAAAAGQVVLDVEEQKGFWVVYLLERDSGGARVWRREWRPAPGS